MTEGSEAPDGQQLDGDGDSRLRAIIDHVADGIVIVSTEGTVRFANPSAARLFGRTPGELVGHPFGFPVANGATEIDVMRRGGAPAVAELRVTPLEWEGEPALVVSLRDVTDRREAEERRRELVREQAARSRAEAEERRFRFLADASAVLDSSLDYPEVLAKLARLVVSRHGDPEREAAAPFGRVRLADWCVVDVVEPGAGVQRVTFAHHDPEREASLARLREEFPPDWKHPSPAMEAMRARRPVLHRAVTDEMLARMTRDPAHAALLRELGIAAVIAVPLVARGETLGALTLGCAEGPYSEAELALAADLAQRSALSLANARLYRQAQEANRAKSDFLAVMSHELRTPLNAIMGYGDLLEAEVVGPINERQREQIERISWASRHLLEIVEEILSFATMEAGREEVHPSRVELGELADEVAALVRPLAERKGLAFEVSSPPEPAEIETDAGKARQILLNLLSNAVKFTEEGAVRMEVRPDGTGHLLTVSDTGVGIPPEHLERVFEPFWQVEQSTSRTAGGTGLGLSVASRLAGLLGGSLRAESASGRGSTFVLWLPRHLPDDPPG